MSEAAVSPHIAKSFLKSAQVHAERSGQYLAERDALIEIVARLLENEGEESTRRQAYDLLEVMS